MLRSQKGPLCVHSAGRNQSFLTRHEIFLIIVRRITDNFISFSPDRINRNVIKISALVSSPAFTTVLRGEIIECSR